MPENLRATPWPLRHLPVFPAVALRALNLLEDPEVPLAEISSIVKSDSAIAAGVLRAVNRADAANRPIDTVHGAIVHLGAERTRSIVIASSLNDFFVPYDAPPFRGLWRHSIACACAAAELAPARGLAPELAYTAGLLHDLGRLALCSRYPDEYAAMVELLEDSSDFTLLDSENKLFDMNHCDAGSWLAERWRLPSSLGSSIARHHAQVDVEDDDLLTVVRDACSVSAQIGHPEAPEQLRQRTAGLNAESLEAVRGKVEADLAGLSGDV